MTPPVRPDITADEFAAMLDRSGDCWEWTGSRNQKGYGLAKFGGFWEGTHRIAWRLATGEPIPARMFICHHCDNPPCCNPDHLYLGTPSQNTRDAYARGLRKPNTAANFGHRRYRRGDIQRVVAGRAARDGAA